MKRLSPYDRGLLGWALFCAVGAAVLLVVLMSACATPTEPSMRSCESACSETVAEPLGNAETLVWMRLAREDVAAMARRGEITLSRDLDTVADPEVQWRSCPFWVGNICAAGSTELTGNLIRVSTFDRPRRGPLVQHETRNALLIRTGNGHLANLVTGSE